MDRDPMMSATAGAVAAYYDEDANADILALAEEPSGEGWTVEIMRAREFDEQDRATGMDSHSVTLDGAVTAYGVIERADVADGRLRVRFTEAGAEELGVDRDCEFVLPGPDDAAAVEQTLPRLFPA